ncbi:unnamed protein product [Calypogeia fissa]
MTRGSSWGHGGYLLRRFIGRCHWRATVVASPCSMSNPNGHHLWLEGHGILRQAWCSPLEGAEHRGHV